MFLILLLCIKLLLEKMVADSEVCSILGSFSNPESLRSNEPKIIENDDDARAPRISYIKHISND